MTDDDLPAPSWRRRALVLLLAAATALAVVATLLWRPGDPKRGATALRTQPAPAAASAGAVGGKADVRLLPAAAAPR